MTSYPAQYGFEAFSVPDYDLEPMDNGRYRFTINESEFNNQWIEVYGLSFGDVPDEEGESQLMFEYESSLGDSNEGIRKLTENLIKEVIIRTMEYTMRNAPNED